MGGILSSILGTTGNQDGMMTTNTKDIMQMVMSKMQNRENQYKQDRDQAAQNMLGERHNAETNLANARTLQTSSDDAAVQKLNMMGSALQTMIKQQGVGATIIDPQTGRAMKNPNFDAFKDDQLKRLALASKIAAARSENAMNQWIDSDLGGAGGISHMPTHSSADTPMPVSGPYSQQQLIYGRLTPPQPSRYDNMPSILHDIYR